LIRRFSCRGGRRPATCAASSTRRGGLDRLIRDLFDLARLEVGASTLHLEPLNWVALCPQHDRTLRAALRASRDSASRGATRLDEAWVEADGHRLEQVLENL